MSRLRPSTTLGTNREAAKSSLTPAAPLTPSAPPSQTPPAPPPAGQNFLSHPLLLLEAHLRPGLLRHAQRHPRAFAVGGVADLGAVAAVVDQLFAPEGGGRASARRCLTSRKA